MQGSGTSAGNWSNSGLPSMYTTAPQQQQQQRTTSNPRAYQSGDQTRDDTMYATDSNQQYANYPTGSYAGLGGYPQTQSYNPVYDTASPASGSRRTSGPGQNVAGTKTSTPPSAAHQSPSTQYNYARQPSSSMYPASAPPHMPSHQAQQQQQQQPQTATASQYSGYADYYNQQQPQQNQYGYYPPTYPSTGASRLPSQPQTAAAPAPTSTDTHRNSGGSFDYSQQGNIYASQYGQHQWQQPGGRSSISGHPGASQWQGYPMATPAVPHGYPSQPGHYPMQSWQGGYYPPGVQPPHTAPPPSSSTKKSKKEPKDEYKGLGKRAPEPIPEEPVVAHEKKGKKAKKEEEKPIPKPPPKSHLHPPRQAQSAWQLFFTDELNKAKAAAVQGNSPGGTPQHAKLNVAQIAKDAGTAYANLDAEQKKYYAQKVVESKEQYARELKVWQATLTPEDIRVENAFRAQQRKDGKSRKGNLKDPNAPKKPLSAYFLFLKGIRENDDLRAKVWADESETTKQSVLAAERWRSLSDDEKRPFLQQAEKDKQDYEAARKVYEDEAAARARGEDFDIKTDPKAEASRTVPPIPMAAVTNEHGQTVSIDSIVAPPTPTVDLQQPTPQVEASTTSPDFAQFTNVSDEDKKPAGTEDETDADVDPTSFDQSMDDFQGFHDPLEDMDLTGLGAMTADGEQGQQQWDDLHNLMGEQTSSTVEQPLKIEETADVDVAPSMAEAVSQTTELPSEPIAQTEPAIQQVAAGAEGEMSVPDAGPTLDNASGEPTEEVSELPQADVPPAVEEPVPAAEPEPEPAQPDFSAGAELGNGGMDAEPAFDTAALGGDTAAAPVEGSTLDVPASPKADETVFPAPEPAPPAEDVTVAPATDNDTAADAAPATDAPAEGM